MELKRLAVLALLASASVPAHAQMVTAQVPQSVANAMNAAGYETTIDKDSVGDPRIVSSFGGTRFYVFFYNCTEHVECATIQFHAGFDLSSPVSLEQINAWNASKRFSRAFLDKENDPVIQMDIDLDDGGVSQTLFIDNLEFWETLLNQFKKHIGFSG